MRKVLLSMLVGVLIVAGAGIASAQKVGSDLEKEHFQNTHKGEGAYHGVNVEKVSVVTALKKPAGSKVVLQGYITKTRGNDRYDFSDTTATGSIETVIPAKFWNAAVITDVDKLEIYGEIHHKVVNKKTYVYCVADRIRKIK